MNVLKQIGLCRNAQRFFFQGVAKSNGHRVFIQKIFIFTVLVFSSINAFSQVFYMYGPNSVCPINPIVNYSFSPTSGCPFGSGLTSTNWSVSGGIFVDSGGTPINPNSSITTSVYV